MPYSRHRSATGTRHQPDEGSIGSAGRCIGWSSSKISSYFSPRIFYERRPLDSRGLPAEFGFILLHDRGEGRAFLAAGTTDGIIAGAIGGHGRDGAEAEGKNKAADRRRERWFTHDPYPLPGGTGHRAKSKRNGGGTNVPPPGFAGISGRRCWTPCCPPPAHGPCCPRR